MVKGLIFSSLGNWLSNNLQILLADQENVGVKNFCIAITFEYLLLKYVTSLVVMIAQFKYASTDKNPQVTAILSIEKIS